MRWFSRLRLPTFRVVGGCVCLAAAIIFIAIDSSFLAQGAARKAATPAEKWQLGLVAATIPVMVSLMPFLFAITWKPGKWIGRPSIWSVVLATVWVAMVGYNIMGAGGFVSHVRSDVTSSRKFAADRSQNTTERRALLAAQIKEIPSTVRSPEAIEGARAAERAKSWWGYSDGCKSADNPKERRFCSDYAKLAVELGEAQRRAKLDAEIKALDDKTVVGGWVAESVDPTARFWAKWTGVSELDMADWDSLTTPIVLQLGSWFFLTFALLMFGFTGHRTTLFGQRVTPQLADKAAGASPAPAPAASLKYQPIQLARWFFSEYTRPGVSGGLEESAWYAQYCNVCAQSSSVPLPLESFRNIAKTCGAVPIEVDGVVTYKRVMPVEPRSAA